MTIGDGQKNLCDRCCQPDENRLHPFDCSGWRPVDPSKGKSNESAEGKIIKKRSTQGLFIKIEDPESAKRNTRRDSSEKTQKEAYLKNLTRWVEDNSYAKKSNDDRPPGVTADFFLSPNPPNNGNEKWRCIIQNCCVVKLRA